MPDTIPAADFAIVCGSANWGLRMPEDLDEPGVTVTARDLTFDTPWGETGDWKLIEIDGALTPDGKPRAVLVVWSHGWSVDHIDHGAQRRVFSVLQQAGVRKVLCCSTAGALNRAVLKGDFTIVNDILELTQTQFSLLPGRVAYDCSGKQLVCPACAATLEDTARELWPAGQRVYGRSAGLVAGHAWGPRLTSPAEAQAHRMLGADITNHSLVPEATLSREIGACFVNCSFITVAYDDYFAPADRKIIDDDMLTGLNPIASRIALRAIARMRLDEPCLCAGLRTPQPASHRDRR
ncbi:5'-methylthioadenosine phosphorylase [Lichenihabitans sp. Uapishka_5]|uniref:phosphorylase family protein n=1 Tax=Lichenihabitans sp. Uapishka_5 TaxID=3037302 RepID=UPI0029E7E11D|nr:5'-methylthioadenosine phosphorylase [Lichenihabitans sp. Uapishka_5]MDX7951757.1 5'-methylthioadenosine phosphorylase [Lichenihabitans sp. Uapishka_5]